MSTDRAVFPMNLRAMRAGCGVLAVGLSVIACSRQTNTPSSSPSPPVMTDLSPAATVPVPSEPVTMEAASAPVLPPTPEEVKAAFKDGVSLFDSGAYAEASLSLLVAAEGRPEHAYTHYLLGLSLWKSGRHREAEQALVRSATLDVDSLRTWTNLARVRMDLDDPSGALEATDSALAIEATSANALHQRGRALAALGRGEEALAALGRAHEADPENGYVANTLGYVLIQGGRAEEAVPFLEAAKERLPGVAYVRNNLGVAYERTGQLLNALAEYRAAVEAGDSGGKAALSLARLEPRVPEAMAGKRQADPLTAPAIAEAPGNDDEESPRD